MPPSRIFMWFVLIKQLSLYTHESRCVSSSFQVTVNVSHCRYRYEWFYRTLTCRFRGWFVRCETSARHGQLRWRERCVCSDLWRIWALWIQAMPRIHWILLVRGHRDWRRAAWHSCRPWSAGNLRSPYNSIAERYFCFHVILLYVKLCFPRQRQQCFELLLLRSHHWALSSNTLLAGASVALWRSFLEKNIK